MSAARLSRPGQWPGRSTVFARGGMVCSSHPLAASAGVDILRRGGNAIDAAIAANAVLGAAEPLQSGVGGDFFALYWSAKDKKLKGLNASGRSPQNLSWRTFARKGLPAVPRMGWGSVTVPGCVDGWWQLHQADGKLPWPNLFGSAIDAAHDGVPHSEVAAAKMLNIGPRLQSDGARRIFTPDGKPPLYGQVFRQEELARTLEAIASGGAEIFYRGDLAAKIVACSEATGGFFTLEDFSTHTSQWQTPLKTTFCDLDIYQLPPNAPGFSVLLALNILTSLGLRKLAPDWIGLTHASIEALKLAFAEQDAHLADPKVDVPLEKLQSLTFATHLGLTVQLDRAIPRQDSLTNTAGDTSVLCVADAEGNLVSLISSLYEGSGVVADGTGIHFHNRGALFSLDSDHSNCLEPRKRPAHTLCPGIAFRHDRPYLAFGSVGGRHQPQALVQFLINFLLHGMSLQEALAAPRFDFRTENFVAYELDYPSDLRETLASRGHVAVEGDLGPFGGMQALRLLPDGVLEGASDARQDGCAIGI